MCSEEAPSLNPARYFWLAQPFSAWVLPRASAGSAGSVNADDRECRDGFTLRAAERITRNGRGAVGTLQGIMADLIEKNVQDYA
jgi:hypothetical protein